MGRPSKRVSRNRKPTTLRNVSPFSKSSSVPGGTSGATIFGSTTKLSMARYRQLAVRKGLTQTRYATVIDRRYKISAATFRERRQAGRRAKWPWRNDAWPVLSKRSEERRVGKECRCG